MTEPGTDLAFDTLLHQCPTLDQYIRYLCAVLKQYQDHSEVFRAMIYLTMIVQARYLCFRLYYNEGFQALFSVFRFASQLGAREQVQLMYELLFVLWSLALEPVLARLLPSGETVHLLGQALKLTSTKVRRMAVAVTACLARHPHHVAELLDSDVHFRLPELLTLAQDLDDPDFIEDTRSTLATLEGSPQRLTLFDRFSRMARSPRMEMSRMLRSEVFWRENITKFERDDFALVMRLIQHLGPCIQSSGSSPDLVPYVPRRLDGEPFHPLPKPSQETMITAAYSLTQFIKFYPRGRDIVEHTGVSRRLLEIMANLGQMYGMDLQDAAVLCMQQLILQTNLIVLTSSGS